MNDKERAKEVLLEIIRQCSGDEIKGKTKLFKAFYLAHLYYAKANTCFLSEWPIVRMPHGPGIDRFDELIGDLESEGLVKLEPCEIGPYPSVRFSLTEKGRQANSPDPEAVSAIRETIKLVSSCTAEQLSEFTHELSKTWNDAEDGEELPVYLDLLDEKEYAAAKERKTRIEKQLDSAWE